MILIISPAKTLDLSEETRYTSHFSLPTHLEETQQLVGVLAEMEPEQIGELMSVSPKLARLNYERYQAFSTPFDPSNAKQALLTFNGDVYTGFDLESYGEEEFEYAQAHLRILSGLYGLLRPLDLIQPYRLEMGTKLSNARGKDLYAFWGDPITQALNQALAQSDAPVLVNLASNEYFKSVQRQGIEGRIITPVFKDIREGLAKTIALFAKQARGEMCDYVIQAKVRDPEALKDFTRMGYHYDESRSTDNEWVFVRES
jgi:uncharacterized protein